MAHQAGPGQRRYDEKYRREHRDKFRAWNSAYRSRRSEEQKTRDRETSRKRKRLAKGIKNATGELKHGPCEICRVICSLHFDHDHSTGLFRGWLCPSCNLALGGFRDSLALLHAAIQYLQK